jgi:hypothetical protein
MTRTTLAAALRELRSRTGLSMAALATKTTFSKSSWERYLNGKTLPPRQAVEDLCRLAGEPEGRCLALWEIAESECSGRATEVPRTGTAAGTATETGRRAGAGPITGTMASLSWQPSATSPLSPPPSASGSPAPAPAPQGVTPVGHRHAAAVAVLASVCAVAMGGVAVALALLPRPNGEPQSSLTATASVTGPHCRGAGCDGRNPMRMRCAAAPDTVASLRTAGGAWMELRHSPECGTSWARMWGTRIGDRLEMTAGGRGGRVRGAEVEDAADADAYVYTPMAETRPGTLVRACFRPAAGGAGECFEGRVP